MTGGGRFGDVGVLVLGACAELKFIGDGVIFFVDDLAGFL